MTDIIVEITGVGGATNLQALTDVNVSGAINGQVLTYDNATSKWIPTAAAGVTTLAALNDVNVSGITDGQMIEWDTTTSMFIAIDKPADQVTSVAGKTGAVVIVKADIADFGTYATTAQGTLADSATQPSDNISTLTNDSGFTNDQTGAEIKVAYESEANTNAFADADVTTLSTALQDVTGESIKDLSDVFSTMTPIAGQVLTYHAVNGWLSQAPGNAPVDSVAGKTGVVTLVKADITDFVEADYATGAEGNLATSALQDITGEAIGSLANVVETGKISGSILKYNGTNWVVGPEPSSTTVLDDLTDVTITTSVDGKVLRNNGIAWSESFLDYSDVTGTPTNVSTFTNDSGYTNDQTGAEIKTAYELELNTNAFTDAQVTNLGNQSGTNTGDQVSSDFDHDQLTNFVANEHIDWTAASQGTIDSTNLPGLALTDVNTVATEIAQLALVAQEGDVAIRTDLNKTYAHNGGILGTMADWSELLTPTDIVTSVAGKTGVVTLVKADITDLVETDYATGAEGDLATSALQDITAEAIGDLSDVTVVAGAEGEVLRRGVGGNWSNDSLQYADLVSVPTDFPVSGFHSNAIAVEPIASGDKSVAIGNGVLAGGDNAVALGQGANAAGWYSVALGFGSYGGSTSSLAIGVNNSVPAGNGLAIGVGNQVNGYAGIAIGDSSACRGYGQIAIGNNAGDNTTAYDASVTIGAFLPTTATAQVRIGTSATEFFEYESSKFSLAGTNAQYVLPNYTVATVPAGPEAGSMIYVTDGNAGAASAAIYDGTNWKVVALGATISAT